VCTDIDFKRLLVLIETVTFTRVNMTALDWLPMLEIYITSLV